MKKSILIITLLMVLQIFMVGCSNNSNGIKSSEEQKVKETIDLVLSYENGYDDTMKKYISEKNFYVCNYVEFYSLYIGELKLKNYESEIVSLREEDDRYIVCMLLNIEAESLETHGEEQKGDEAIGENIPVEVILKEKDGQLYIESFKEYENLDKAKELNEGFN